MSTTPRASTSLLVKQIKEVERGRITEYAERVPAPSTTRARGIWSVPCDIALPCATQNELDWTDAEALVANGCMAVAEGANMPTTPEAIESFQEHGVLFCPGQGCQRRRRGHLRSGDDPELRAPLLDLRGGGRAS